MLGQTTRERRDSLHIQRGKLCCCTAPYWRWFYFMARCYLILGPGILLLIRLRWITIVAVSQSRKTLGCSSTRLQGFVFTQCTMLERNICWTVLTLAFVLQVTERNVKAIVVHKLSGVTGIIEALDMTYIRAIPRLYYYVVEAGIKDGGKMWWRLLSRKDFPNSMITNGVQGTGLGYC